MQFFGQKFQHGRAGFFAASRTDKLIFIIGAVTAVGLLVEHIFFHSGIVKISAGRAQDCNNTSTGEVWVIEIRNNQFIPSRVEARVCDRLRFVNRDSAIHEPALGQHPSHINYPGFEEKGLVEDDNNQFVLNLPGEFSLHDHLNEDIQGTLIVK